MSAPTQNDHDLSRREEMSISGAALSGAPWGAAVLTGGVVAAGDLGLHVIRGGLGLSAVMVEVPEFQGNINGGQPHLLGRPWFQTNFTCPFDFRQGHA